MWLSCRGLNTDQATGAVPLRREIRDLQKNFPDQWNVYLLGLKDFQETDENDPLSYYQIAGREPSMIRSQWQQPVANIHRARYPWPSIQGVERCGGQRYHGVLHSLLNPFPNVASPVFGII